MGEKILCLPTDAKGNFILGGNMNELKIGDKVKIVSDEDWDEYHLGNKDRVGYVESVYPDGNAYVYSKPNGDGERLGTYKPNQLQKMSDLPKTLDDLQKDDLIEWDGCTRKILARVEDLVAVSYADNHAYFYSWHSIARLKDSNATLLNQDKTKEEEAIKLLEKAGRIKNGKIIN